MVTLNYLPIICLLAMWLPISNLEYIPPGPLYGCPKETQRLLLYPCVCEKGTDSGLYVRCENTGLAVLSVGLGNLAGLGLPIERLILKECKIGKYHNLLVHLYRCPLLIFQTDLISLNMCGQSHVMLLYKKMYTYIPTCLMNGFIPNHWLSNG